MWSQRHCAVQAFGRPSRLLPRLLPSEGLKETHGIGDAMTIRVTARHGEHAERMLQRFRRICSKEGIFREVKRRRFYEKPSVARRRKAKEAVRALRRRLKREARMRRRG